MPTQAPRVPRTLIAGVTAVVALSGVLAAPDGAAATPVVVGGFARLDLVGDVAGAARSVDPNLVNPWGLSASPTGPLWVSDNGSSTSTVYSGATSGGQGATVVPLVVSIPGGGAPTGQVYNPTGGFLLPTGGPALFVFAGENGDLSAWNGSQGSTAVVVAASTGGVYKGLALVTTPTASTLLAADFHGGRIDVFDSAFHRLNRPNAFPSTGVPAGYAPFNVAVLGNLVYVSYAEQDAARHDDVRGAGHGYVNVFSRTGRFLRSLAAQGPLNSPWGMAVAPAGFGAIAGDLLVGNFGDGRIHVFTAAGTLVETLASASGRPVVIPGLWGLLPGNGTAGRTSDVWFSAGPGHESHGLLGILRPSGA